MLERHYKRVRVLSSFLAESCEHRGASRGAVTRRKEGSNWIRVAFEKIRERNWPSSQTY